MVVFTCQYCNASLKKKAVESHRFQCRRDYHLSCIDCLQDFFGNEYAKHISCISEEQKYGGKNFMPSSAAGKQVIWVSAINAALKSETSNQIKEVLDAASSNPNVPRARKKFMNYFQNQGAFKFNKFLNQAYDAAEAELKKLEVKQNKPNNSPQKTDSPKPVEETQKKKEKKRKTISETQEDIENGVEKVNHEVNHVETKNKKKKKLREGSHCEAVTVPENQESKKSKKKKKKSVSLDEDQVVEEEEHNEKQKKSKENGTSSYVIDLSGDDVAIPEGNEDNVDETSPVFSEEWSHLSKKERKKLIKQMKYEAEITSIENYNKENEETPEPSGKKKKKKDKMLNGDVDPKRETKNSVSEPDGKKPKLEEVEEVVEEVAPSKPKKFRWDRMILEVLKGAPDQEMPLKRLSRKVCGEYQLLFGDKESYDDILLTFNKKVMKTHGVRVFKDKAKIVS